MPLNYVGDSQMYPWCQGTNSPLCGECEHKCYGPKGKYCYVESSKDTYKTHMTKYSGEYRLAEHEFKENFYKHGEGITIFMENMGDLFAKGVPFKMIARVLEHCKKFPKNVYLFQSKNPGRFIDFYGLYPPRVIFGTTIETDAYPDGHGSEAPSPRERALAMTQVGGKRMVSVEPILDFDVEKLSSQIAMVGPNFVSIGADSKNRGLTEPPGSNVLVLIERLKRLGIEVRTKKNLKRILEG